MKQKRPDALPPARAVNRAVARMNVNDDDRDRATAKIMRLILRHHAHRLGFNKLDARPSQLYRSLFASHDRNTQLIEFYEALNALAAHDAQKAAIVELRLYSGLSLTEIATTLKLSRLRVAIDWTLARAWINGWIRAHRH